MSVSKLVMLLFTLMCFLQEAGGLLYGIVPKHLLVKIDRLRFLQTLEEQKKRLQEADGQHLYFQMLQHHKKEDPVKVDDFVNKLDEKSRKHSLEVKSSDLLSVVRNALLNPSPSFKYSFVG